MMARHNRKRTRAKAPTTHTHWLEKITCKGRPVTPQQVLKGLGIALSIVVSAYLAILYFGHQTVPNSDFTAFLDTGRTILSFELPSSFKRLPGLGMLQAVLSWLMPGRHPGLTAGWVLNSILFVGTGFFLYQIARKVIDTAAIWLTLIVLINPMVLRWLQHPIAETTLIFFIVMTFYFLLKPTRWAYVPAMLTALIRYEGAILILLCFCYDFFTSKNWKARLLSFVRAGFAALPLALWMLGMVLTRKPGTGVTSLPYISNFEVTRQMVIGKFATVIWSNGVGSLFVLPTVEQMRALQFASKAILVLAILLAIVFSIIRRNWRVLALLGFFGCFFVLHAIRTYTMPRYGLPAVWVTVLVAFYGLKSGWDWLVEKKVLPEVLQGVLQVIVAIVSIVWAGSLFKYLSQMAPMSRASNSIPSVTMAVVVIVLLVRFAVGYFGLKKLTAAAAIFAAMLLMTVSNQLQVIQKVGNGSIDREFKYLADWYYDHAEDGEIMLTTLPHVVTLFLPEDRADDVLAMQRVGGATTQDFLQTCAQRGVVYIAWDSRIGLTPDNIYYRRWHMERVDILRQPSNHGPLRIVEQIRNEDYPNRFINIYRLELPAGAGAAQP